ncbi:MAG TPA: 30S ribosomal protein S4 [bacterium]|nr:30S ribosomal protein S4 [bacterium]HOR57251.1 30S ribosomal protein S4 [bacterium]HPL55918.1 30S ribosomal protein S4 [bacterium]
MSQPVKSVSKLSRSVGENLFLKGERDEGQKNAMTRRPYGPGQHGQSRRGKPSDYARQLKEKQKVRYSYYLSEEQLRRIFKIANRSQKNTGEHLLQLLELRVDNILYRCGFASSRRQARQLVSHGHILVDGKKVKTPSYVMAVGQTIEAKKTVERETARKKEDAPTWLEVSLKGKKAKVVAVPSREQIQTTIEEQLVVEYYSRLT